MINPINFINTLRESDKVLETVYMNGGCYQFYEVLKSIFPQAKPYLTTERDHVITEIDGKFYDIRGYSHEKANPLISKWDITMCQQWGFSKWKYLTENCSWCGEPQIIVAKEDGMR